ncbi:HET-domain-containing protein, partial [Lentithecium fluviatile CBS 122367]
MQSRVYGDLHYPDSIRFLRLHGSDDFESPIHCSLELARLYDPCLPLFEAVSYTWADLNGDDTLSDRVYLDSDHRILPATRNCVAALRRFRTAQDRLLWVDAICINQVDLAERATQVGLMREIYSFAGRVIVYLGEE